jgi:uncharacterized phage protein (TIGR01671 family)
MSNDRFKFRLWCNKNKKYLHTLGEATAMVMSINPLIGLSNMSRHNSIYYGDLEGFEHITAEQCTGLRDKNDTLIYEGDVLFNVCSWGAYGGVVEWDGSSWVLNIDGEQMRLIDDLDPSTLLIDSNIHENLLEA